MRFFVFVYGKNRGKRFLLSKDKNSMCRILLPGDDFLLDETVFLEMKNISGEWYVKETKDYKINKEQFFQMEIQRIENSIFYRLSEARKYRLHVKEREICIQFICSRHEWSIYEKYVLKACTVLEQKNRVVLTGDVMHQMEGIKILYENDKWILKNCGKGNVYVNEFFVEDAQNLNYGDILYIFGRIFLFFEEYMAIEKLGDDIDTYYLDSIEIQEKDEVRRVRTQSRETFHRAPRLMESLEKKSIQIEGPPVFEEQEQRSLFMEIGAVINMIVPMLGMNLFLIYGTKSEQGQLGLYIYSGLFMAIISVVCSVSWIIISRHYEERTRRKKYSKRIKSYRKYLDKKNIVIRNQYEKIYKVLWSRYLSMDAYKNDALLFLYLWNRNPYHEDFLKYRIGTGNTEFPVKVELQNIGLENEEDTLWKEAGHLKKKYAILHQVPILLDIKKYSQVGIIAEYTDKGMEIIRNLVLQIAMCNCYTEVKIVCVYDKNKMVQYGQWDFFRWLPHIWDSSKQRRFIAQSQAEARELFYRLLQIFKERETVSDSNHSEERIPHYVLFIAEEEYLQGEMFSKYIFNKKENYGITVIWIASRREKLPNTCKLILENSREFSGWYEVEKHSQRRKEIQFDLIKKEVADRLIRMISGTKVAEIEEKRGIPDTIDFLHMYGAESIEELDIENRWNKNRTYDSCRVLIGRKAGGESCYLDVHERYHGPHGLLAGTTGSGKSEVLQTFILSMAINFSPEAVNFLLIDYKGEGMSGMFSDLPHISGKISNLSDGQTYRAMISIKSENRRRQKIFKKFKVNNINDYTKLFIEGETKEAIPHLLIIIDEFAELKKAEPEFMQELISVAQVGRSLGVHLILATQKPGGVVDDKIWSNSRFRICLKVQEREDSMDMLHNMDACRITQTGRGYLQVGNNEVYDLFQAGWSGAPYELKTKRQAVQLVRLNGSVCSAEDICKKMGSMNSINNRDGFKIVKQITQLEAIKSYLVKFAKGKGYDKRKRLWMEPLPKYLYMDIITGKKGKENNDDNYNSNHGHDNVSHKYREEFSCQKEQLKVCVGLFDDPENQEQPAFYLNLIESGHIGICGRSVSGKSTFLQTFVFSLLQRASEEEVSIYILDCNGGGMNIYAHIPQVQKVVSEEEEEQINIVFQDVQEELKRRKRKLSGGTFKQYKDRAEEKENLPLILIVLDGFAEFSETTYQKYEEVLYQILREGEKLGILIIMTTDSFSSMRISMRLSELFKTKICFYMKDTYAYTEVFDVMKLPVLPQSGIPGRGIAYYGERILEFQTALAAEEQNDYKRQEKIKQILFQTGVR